MNVVKEIKDILQNMSVEYCFIDEFILKLYNEKVMQVYDSLEDDYSKKIYSDVILYRMKGNFAGWNERIQNPYFEINERFMEPNMDEVFIDCGAYIGDTLEQYVKMKNGIFKKIIAFEPDINNFNKLRSKAQEIVEEYHLDAEAIELHQNAVSDHMQRNVIQRYNDGRGSKLVLDDYGEEVCEVIALDGFIEEYTFLKADIESFEYRMLLGAKEGIKKFTPKLAICIYHNAVDMYSIPLLIKSIVPEYHFAVRQHSNMGDDTVLYAWVE